MVNLQLDVFQNGGVLVGTGIQTKPKLAELKAIHNKF